MTSKIFFVLLSSVCIFCHAEDLTTAMPINEIEKQLFIRGPRKIRTFKVITEAFESKNYSRMLREARKLELNEEFLDYYYFLTGLAEKGRMGQFLANKNRSSANAAGVRATESFSRVLASNPFTPLQKRAVTLWGETEIALAQIHLRNKNKKKAMSYFESGFQRLNQTGLLSIVPKSAIIDYALLCETKPSSKVPTPPSPMCESWELKLAAFISKSDEAKLSEKILALKQPSVVNSANSYSNYKIDLDLQAFNTGFQHYLNERYLDAYISFRNLLAQYPRTTIKYRTKFWMARSAQKSNHLTQAETIYREIIRDLPFSYFAMLSSWFSGINLSRMMDSELPMAVRGSPLLAPSDLIHLRRAEIFLASGALMLARYELREIVIKEYMPNEFLMYLSLLNHLAGNHTAVFKMGSELSNRGHIGLSSPYGQKLLFPTTFINTIRAVTSSQTDQLIALSLMKQESAFDHEAVSVSHAYGLMQLIRPTARELDPEIEISDLFEPHKNVKLGVQYLRQMLARYKGNIILALAAYNAGPSNADRWGREAFQENSKPLPPEEMIELISFRETREYVQNILRNIYWYHRRLNSESFENIDALLQWASKATRAPAARKIASPHKKPKKLKR